MNERSPAVPLLRARTQAESQIVLALLRAEGIVAYVGGQALTDEFAASQRLLGLQGTRIDVAAGDLPRARELLAEARRCGRLLDSEPGGGGTAGPLRLVD
jgi:hypothetical protein